MTKLITLLTKKIRTKIIAAIISVFIVSSVLVFFTSTPVLFRTFTRDTYNELTAVADAVDFLVPSSGSYYFDLYSLSENHNVDFEIVDVNGFLLYTTQGSGSAMSNSHFSSSGSNIPEYDGMKESGSHKIPFRSENFEIKKKLATNADYFIYTRTISTGDVLHVYYPVADVESVVAVADKVYFAISITLLVVLGIVSLLIVSKFTKPVEEINDVTRDMAALNFERKCDDYGSDEMGELGRSINILSDTLNSTLQDLKEKNIQLEKDIELKLALDNARKSFISNVSHELKTPIAIISGYAEGLYEGISDDPEITKEYCRIINDESQKMNNLVLELLELSKLESSSNKFTPAQFDIGKTVSVILDHLSLQFEAAGIEAENNIPASLECYAEEDKIEIVLKNYITNAISHCSGDRKMIRLDCEDKDSLLRFSVFNTGTNIDPEDLPELWESFYRADKSHSRSSNRFGLGLSIVRSIMENHKCSYGVENVENGVIFSFEVPKDSDYYEEKEN